MSNGPRVLFLGGSIYSTHDPLATAFVIDGDLVAWVGSDSSAHSLFDGDASIVTRPLDGCLVTPSFVDSCPREQPAAVGRGITAVVPNGDGIAPHLDPSIDFLSLASAGAPFAFGSGGTSDSPWEWVRAASVQALGEHRVSARAAFLASTRAGRRLLGDDHPGALNPGVIADFVLWEPWDLIVHGNDERIQTWSTDPRSRTPLLPDLSGSGVPAPRATYVSGQPAWCSPSAEGVAQ